VLAAHDDCDGRDSYRDMKKRYRNLHNMMEVFVAFAVPQLFVGLMFKRLTFGEKLLFILAVSLRLFFEAIGLRPRVCRGDGVKTLLNAFCLIKIPRVGCTSSWSTPRWARSDGARGGLKLLSEI
jgi:hypothetical protein